MTEHRNVRKGRGDAGDKWFWGPGKEPSKEYSGGQNPFNVLNFGKEVFMEIVIKYEKCQIYL